MADDKGNLKFLQDLNKEQQRLNDLMKSTTDFDARIRIQEEAIANSKRIQAEQERLISESKSKNNTLTASEKKELDNILKTQKNINEEVKREGFWREVTKKTLRDYNSMLRSGLRYLMDSDKVIKNTILNLGLSSTKAAEMRGSFEESARFVAHIGGNLEDVQKIMEGFAEETGRARALSAEMVQDIALIGKGTGLGIEQGAKLGAQFELMGINAKSAMDYVQNVVDTSERMGVNTTKVLKNVTENFKKLQTMNFQQGVKGYAQMAQYAEKMKIDMNGTFAAMDKVKTLEGAIDTFAQLQVMGGEFAKQDFLEMFYLKRNDPAKFQERINQMTKGLVSFRKKADGSMEKFISPADRDRIAQVSQILGKDVEKYTEEVLRMSEMERLRSKMQGMGLSGAEKELIEGAAQFNTQTGAFEAKIAGQMRDITTLTKAQAQSFAKESVTLKQRAVEAQTVEDAFKATILELKSALLPLLKSINVMLSTVRETIKPIIDGLTKGPMGWLKVAGAFMGAAFLWRTVSIGLNRVAENLVKGVGGRVGNLLGNKTVESLAPTGSISGLAEQRKGIGAGALAKGQGMKAMGIGAGVGAGALGVGAGIGAAAVGVSKLADAMAKLTPEQAKTLQKIVGSLGWFTLGGAIVAGAIIAIGMSSTIAAPGLLTLGGAVLMIGGGIALATAGIGLMAVGLGKLISSSKEAGPAMLGVGKGIGIMSMAMLGFSAGAIGVVAFAATMKSIAKNAPALGQVGDAFGKIGAVLSGNKEDFIAVDNAIKSIANTSTKGGSAFAELATLLKTPLKVEFANKEVAVVSNITMNIDGQKFHQVTKTGAYVTQNTVDAKAGKSGPV